MEIEVGRYPREGWARHGDIPGYDTDSKNAHYACVVIRDTGELKQNRGKRVCFEVRGTGLYDGKYVDASLHILPSMFGYYDLTVNEVWKGHPEQNGTIIIHFYDESGGCPFGDRAKKSRNYNDYKNREKPEKESFGFGRREHYALDVYQRDFWILVIIIVVVGVWIIYGENRR